MKSRYVPAMVSSATCVVALAVPSFAYAAGAPAPVSNLQLSSKDSVVYADWTASPDTDGADVCWSTGAAPSTPADPAASCSGPLTSPGYSFAATKGQMYGVSVFSYDASTGTYGSPVSGSITAADAPPLAPVGLNSRSNGNHTVYLGWQDAPANDDTVDFIVDWKRGMTAPPLDTGTDHVTKYAYLPIDGLADGIVYTFAVYARDASGQIGPATLLRAATRKTGIYVATDDPKLHSPVWAGYTTDKAVATMAPDAHLRVLYRTGDQLYYLSRKPANNKFEHSFRVAPHVDGTQVLASSPNARLLAVWPSGSGLHYRFRSANTWGAEHTLTTNATDVVFGATYDDRNGYVLARTHGGRDRGLWLYHYAAGRWHSSRVPGSGAGDVGALTQDTKTGDVVVVDRHQVAGASDIRVATLPAGRTTVTRPTTWTRVGATGVVPTSVASVAGDVTIGVQRSGGGSAAGVYVVREQGGHHTGLIRVRGTSSKDQDVVVTALQSDHAVISWRRTSGSWSPDDIGVWASQAVRTKSGWHETAPKRWSTSAYDFPVGAFRSTAGHLYVVYTTAQADVTE